jgi:hypothetical protein
MHKKQRRIKRTTVGANRPMYSNLLLRQGIDSEFPRPYVHKVGSVGAIKPIGTSNGLLASLGVNTGYRSGNVCGLNIQGEVLCLDPQTWESGESLFDNVGPVQYIEPQNNGQTLVRFRPCSSSDTVEQRVPTECCVICMSKDDFIGWCESINANTYEASGLWDEMLQAEEGDTVGGSRHPF